MTDHAAAGFAALLYRVEGPVALIALNRPDSLNAMTAAMQAEIVAAAALAEADPAVRAVVLAGEGRGFCAGADLRDVTAAGDVETLLLSAYKPALDAIAASAKPWIAAVQGPCAGIGASFLMRCDLAVMEETAYLYEAFAAIGLIPDGGAHWHLLRALGAKRAYAAIVGAEKLSAEDCLAAGIVNRLAPEGAARDAAMAWAAQLAQGAPRTLKHAKAMLRLAAENGYDASYAHESALQADCAASGDARDAVEAFFQKRKPVFTGD